MIWERRADMVSALGATFVIGWLSCSGYYSITHLWQVQASVPKIQAEAKCEHHRADVSTHLAVQAIVSAESDDAVTPSTQALPKDCPHAPVVAKK